MLLERDMRLRVSEANREVMGHVSDVVTWVGELPVVIGKQGRLQTDCITNTHRYTHASSISLARLVYF